MSYQGELDPELFEDLGGDAGELEQEWLDFGAIAGVAEQAGLQGLISSGNRNENDLTNQVFFARHPELPKTPLRKDQTTLVAEWLRIRDQMVRPALQGATAGTSGGGATPSSANVPLGTLVRSLPGKPVFRYAFTAHDFDQATRMLIGEAGGDDNAYNKGTLWALINRYAFLGDKVKSWGSFGGFLKAYSQSLRPVAKWESVKDLVAKCNSTFDNKDCHFRPTSTELYPGTQTPMGNTKRIVDTLKTPFGQLPASARRVVYMILSGQVPCNVGNATDVADTKVFYKRKYGRWPSYAEWEEYTRNNATSRGYEWRKDQIPFDQFKHHALFVDPSVKKYPEGVVQIISPSGQVSLPSPAPAPAPSTPAPAPAPLPPAPSTGGQVPDGKTPLPGTTETRRSWTTNPPYRSQPGQRDAKTYNNVLDQFAVGANARYAHRKNANGSVSTFCNIYVWDVTRAMGAEVPHWIDKSGNPAAVGKGNELDANSVFDWLHRHGPRFGWSQVPLDQAISSANAGRPVVVVMKKPGGIGHVAMMRPGQATEWGPWMAQAGAINSSWVRLWAGGPQKGIFKKNSPAVEFFTHD